MPCLLNNKLFDTLLRNLVQPKTFNTGYRMDPLGVGSISDRADMSAISHEELSFRPGSDSSIGASVCQYV